MDDDPMGKDALKAHLHVRFLPIGFAPILDQVLKLLMENKWAVADDMVLIPPGLPRVESAVQTTDDGSQLIRVMDVVKSFDLLELLPPELNWVQRHPSWKRRAGQ
jgi:hypothetical protein